MEFTPLASLVYFLLNNPNKPRKMGSPILPKLVDDSLSGMFSGNSDDMTDALWYLKKFPSALVPKIKSNITFSLLYNVEIALGGSNPDRLFHLASRYSPEILKDQKFYFSLCEKVVQFHKNFRPPKKEFEIDKNFVPYLGDILTYLESVSADSSTDGDEMQRFLFEITKKNELNQRQWFVFLYNVFLDSDSGPKMGPYFSIIGLDDALKLVREKIAQYDV